VRFSFNAPATSPHFPRVLSDLFFGVFIYINFVPVPGKRPSVSNYWRDNAISAVRKIYLADKQNDWSLSGLEI
jgi:hypothetical protein